MRIQLFAARFKSVAADHCARRLPVFAVPCGVQLRVTPETPTTDAAPELARMIVILVPIGNATVASSGIDIITAEVEFVSIMIPSSPSTRV
jgi:hypothetical protein